MVLNLSLHLTSLLIQKCLLCFRYQLPQKDFYGHRKRCAILLMFLPLTNSTIRSVSAPVAFVPLPYTCLFWQWTDGAKTFIWKSCANAKGTYRSRRNRNRLPDRLVKMPEDSAACLCAIGCHVRTSGFNIMD